MKINTRKRKFTLASVVLLAAVSNMIVSQSAVEAVTTTIKNQVSNGEVVIYAQAGWTFQCCRYGKRYR